MPAIVYTLCFITSAICAGLLLRAYLRTRTRLLLWSATAFICLGINNFFVIADMIIFPDANILPFRYAAGLAAVCVLIYGFIWEVE